MGRIILSGSRFGTKKKYAHTFSDSYWSNNPVGIAKKSLNLVHIVIPDIHNR